MHQSWNIFVFARCNASSNEVACLNSNVAESVSDFTFAIFHHNCAAQHRDSEFV